jgi:hypothetical protein
MAWGPHDFKNLSKNYLTLGELLTILTEAKADGLSSHTPIRIDSYLGHATFDSIERIRDTHGLVQSININIDY